MRIALVADCYHPTRNGVTRVVDTLTRGLRERGHEVTLVVPRPSRGPAAAGGSAAATGATGATGADLDVEVASLPLFPGVGVRFAPCSARRLSTLFRERHIEVVHTHTEGPLGLAARNAALLLRVPAVHTLHTCYEHYLHYLPPTRLAPRTARRATTALLERFLTPYTRVIAPSERVRDQLRATVPATGTVLVPNGIPAAPTPDPVAGPRLRRRLGLPEGGRLVLYVGRVAEEKRSGPLVDALTARMSAREGSVALLIGGGGELRRLRAVVQRRGLEDRIRLPGYLPHEDVLALYPLASVFVTTSMSENHPLTLLEAAQAGVPLAVREDAGLGSVAVDGLNAVTAARDGDLVRRALALLDDDVHLARLGAASHQVARGFTATAHVESTGRVYRNVLEEHRRAQAEAVSAPAR